MTLTIQSKCTIDSTVTEVAVYHQAMDFAATSQSGFQVLIPQLLRQDFGNAVAALQGVLVARQALKNTSGTRMVDLQIFGVAPWALEASDSSLDRLYSMVEFLQLTTSTVISSEITTQGWENQADAQALLNRVPVKYPRVRIERHPEWQNHLRQYLEEEGDQVYEDLHLFTDKGTLPLDTCMPMQESQEWMALFALLMGATSVKLPLLRKEQCFKNPQVPQMHLLNEVIQMWHSRGHQMELHFHT